jgi:PAS domain S-box-containing protein
MDRTTTMSALRDQALPPPTAAGTGMAEADDYLGIPFQGIVEQSLAGIYIIQDEIFRYVNATFAGIIGYTPAEMRGMHLSRAVPPDTVDEVIRNYHRRVSGEEPSIRFFTKGQHRAGHVVMLEVHGSRLIYQGRPAVVGVGIDISERVRDRQALEQSRQQLQELAAYINTVREEQRARIARELHDVIGGMLTSAKLDLQRLQRRLDQTPRDDDARQITDELLQLTQETIASVREMSELLRPGAMDHLGLAAAVQADLARFAERSGIACRIAPQCIELELTQDRATSVFRIFQEALTNIARHAQASRVEVSLAAEDGWLQLTVGDNGTGMPATSPTGKRIGLIGMAERARELGGTLHIGSPAEGGTRLTLRVPLDEMSKEEAA